VLTLDRSDVLNALNWETIWALGDACTEVGSDDEVAAIVVTGAGDAFSAGGDINDQKTRAEWPLAAHVTSTGRLLGSVRAIFECPKPVIAAVNGVAAGGGAGLALLCDYRIASHRARIGFAYPRIGLGPDFGVSWTLPRIVSPGQASRLLFTGEYVDATEALRIGLVDELAEGDALDAAMALCRRIESVAPLSVRWAKAGLRRAEELSFAQAIEAELTIQHIGRNTHDHREGVTAFLERRTPDFTGR
jgi:enoyl-CoA hydratase/carnithine racemase